MERTLAETSKDSADALSWYDEISGGYEELYGEEQSRKYAHVFRELLLRGHMTLKNQVILDLGCGAGNLIEFLYNELRDAVFPYYVGLDLSPSMCFLSRKRIEGVGLLGDVVAGDVFRLPFRDKVANTIFSITVFTCRDQLRGVVLDLKNLLRSNGLLCYTILCSDSSKILRHDLELCEAAEALSQREVLCVAKS